MWTRDIRPSNGALIALVLVFVPVAAHADVKEVDLKDLVAGSDLIVVATVTTVEDGPNGIKVHGDEFRPVKVATARVIETWKGDAVREIRYVASPTWTCDSTTAEKGERVVLFLKKQKASTFLAVAHAGRGRMPLRDVGKKSYATLQDEVILPKGTPTISETKTARESFPSAEAGKPAPAPLTFTYSVVLIELGTLRDLVRRSQPTEVVRPRSG